MPPGVPPPLIQTRETTPGEPMIPADFPSVWPEAREMFPKTARSIRVIYFGHGDRVRVINEAVIARRDGPVNFEAILGPQGFRGVSQEAVWMATHQNGTRIVYGMKDSEEVLSLKREYPIEGPAWAEAAAHLMECIDWGPFDGMVGLVTDMTLIEIEENGTRFPTTSLTANIGDTEAQKFRQICSELDFEPIEGELGEEAFAKKTEAGAHIFISLTQSQPSEYLLSLKSVDPRNVGIAVVR